MRGILGGAVFVIGAGALGWWGTAGYAPDIEGEIGEEAAEAVSDTIHAVDVTVSGRDIVVSGLADSEAEKSAILAALEDVDGQRVVRDDLDLVPPVSPFAVTMRKDAELFDFDGVIPSETARAVLAQTIGPGAGELVVASGAPDTAWTQTAAQGHGALSFLKSGVFTLEDQTLFLEGLAATPVEKDEAEAALAALPAGYAVTTEIDVEDDGLPFSLNATQSPEALEIAGKLPAGTTPADLGIEAFGEDVRVAQIAPISPDFTSLSAAGLGALSRLVEGTLSVADGTTPALTLTGTAPTPAVADDIRAALAAPGDTIVDLRALDDGSPLRLSVVKSEGSLSADGKLPFETGLALEGPIEAPVPLGPPGFEATASAGLAALARLQDGTLTLEGTTLTLTGSGTRSAIAAALDDVATLPAGFDLVTEFTPLDDGLPLGINAEKSGGMVKLLGKMPFGTAPESIGIAEFGEAMIVSEVDANADGFLDTVRTGLTALAALDTGRMTVTDAAEPGGPATLRISGSVTRAGLDQVNEAFAALPSGVAPVIDVVFADDGVPMQMTAELEGDGLDLSGKLPFQSAPADLGVESFGDGMRVAEIDANSPRFLSAAAAGITALDALESGLFSVLDSADAEGEPTLSISGTARTPVEKAAALAALESYEFVEDISTRDDGTPPAFTVAYDASSGARLSGKLPQGLGGDSIAARLGLSEIENAGRMGLVGDATALDGKIEPLGGLLFEVDALSAQFGPESVEALSLTPSPGVDVALLVEEVEEVFSVTPEIVEAELPEIGDTRFKVAAGRDERFSGFSWLPIYDFEQSVAGCTAQSEAILAETKINFLTGSAQLDLRSVRAVNALSAAMLHCIEGRPTLMIEVAGHTDAQGDEVANLALSQERADAVVAALSARGVPRGLMISAGYGESRPIADNDTAEGRAANRRTEITWSDS
ncbi:MAG: OmpA family protein [Pseudomonadota bacterium]